MARYIKPVAQGGATPLIRYVSNALLARIKQTDYDDYSSVLPIVKNGLSSDASYQRETTRTEESLQSWEALQQLCYACCTGDITADLASIEDRIMRANNYWGKIAQAGFTAGVEAQCERLESMRGGIRLFREWAELT
jgi:hypothetical protein